MAEENQTHFVALYRFPQGFTEETSDSFSQE